MGWNIGPETMVYDPDILRDTGTRCGVKYNLDLDSLINKETDTSFVQGPDYSLSAYGVPFKKNVESTIGRLCQTYYNDRKAHKKHYLKKQSQHQEIVEELRRRGVAI